MGYNAVRYVPVVFIFEVINMPIIFTDEQINDIIKLYTIDKIGAKKIGERFGCREKPIKRILSSRGIEISSAKVVTFTDSEAAAIFAAYDSGIGANGIASHLGLACSDSPVIRLLRSKYGTLRGRSEQQLARMARSTPEQIAALTANAHAAVRGVKLSDERVHRSAIGKQGKISNRSKWESVVASVLSDTGLDFFPGLAVHRYNIDFAIGNVAVEVFGGGWSVTDKVRISKYISRTKKIAEFGYNTIFLVLDDHANVITADQLRSEIELASSNPPDACKYRVIWGDRHGSTGLCSDIDDSAFVRPFIHVRDRATGRYHSVPR